MSKKKKVIDWKGSFLQRYTDNEAHEKSALEIVGLSSQNVPI